jgi:hypothetical protein
VSSFRKTYLILYIPIAYFCNKSYVFVLFLFLYVDRKVAGSGRDEVNEFSFQFT